MSPQRRAFSFTPEQGVPPEIAYACLSAAAYFFVSQVVIDVKGVHCLIQGGFCPLGLRGVTGAPPARFGARLYRDRNHLRGERQ